MERALHINVSDNQWSTTYGTVRLVAETNSRQLLSAKCFGWLPLAIMLFLITPVTAQKVGNPVFPGYNADPDAQLFGNALTVVTTGFRTHSSYDLDKWVKEPNSFPNKPEDCDGCRNWAPAVTRFQERYFAFITGSVYVGDSPIGPFYYVKNNGGAGGNTGIDAHGFLDDDGKLYHYSGNTKLVITEYEDDLEDEATRKKQIIYKRSDVGLSDYFEGPFMVKRNGIYYITYSSSNWRRDLYNVRYSTSTSPWGPWEYGGQILVKDATHKGPGHHSIFKLPGTDEYYIVYHRYNTTEGGLLHEKHPRVTCIDRMYFEPDGSIRRVEMTDDGVEKIEFPASAMKVTSMSLMNADTDKDLTLKMSEGQKVNLKTTGNNLNLRANVFGLAGSVCFDYDGKTSYTVDNTPPYSIGGDDGAKDFEAWTPSPGKHTVKVTPYTEANAKGEPGTPMTFTFTVDADGAPETTPVAGVSISGPSTITSDGGSVQLSVAVSPSDATNKSVSWAITGTDYNATITSGGKLIASGEDGGNGTVTVRATARDGSGESDEHTVTISNQLTPGGDQCVQIEAEDRDAQKGGYTGDDALVTMQSGEWIGFDINLSGASTITVSAARGDGSAAMEVRLGSPTGQSLGSKTVSTGGWRTFKDFTYAVPSSVSGMQKVYIRSGDPEKPVTRSISVDNATNFSKAAAQYDYIAASLRNRDFYFVSIQDTWIRFDDVNLDGVNEFRGRIANGVTGKLRVRLGSPTGQLVATFDVAATDWREFADYTAQANETLSGTHDLYLVHTAGGSEGGHGGVVDFIAVCGSGVTPPTPSKEYTITASAGSNGSISPSGSIKAEEGQDQTFTITPQSGYQIKDVLVDGKSQGKKNKYTFSKVAQAHTISASFEVVPPTTVAVSSVSVTGTSTITTDGGSTQLSASVSPSNASDKSVKWTIQGKAYGATLSSSGKLTASGEDGGNGTITVRATAQDGSDEFGEREVTITNQSTPPPSPTQHTITASAGSNGSISPSGSVAVEEGEDQSFTISVSSGYQIKDVLVDGSSVGKKSKHTFTNVTAAHTISASFEKVPDTEAPSKPVLNASSTTQSGVTLSWSPATDNVAVTDYELFQDGAKIADLSATKTTYTVSGLVASTNYAFVLEAHDAAANSSASDALIVTTLDPDAVTFTITATASDNGNISPTGQVIVAQGQDQPFTITPDDGYETEDVLVDGSSVGAMSSFTFPKVAQDHTISASFVAIPDNQAPTTPVLASPQQDQNTVTLTWAAASDNQTVATYTIWQNGQPIATQGADTLSFTLLNLPPGEHTFTITATDAAGNATPPSQAVSVTVPPTSANDSTDTQAPEPFELTAVADEQGFTLAWTTPQDNYGITSYILYQNGNVIDTLTATATTYRLATLSADSTYTFTLVAFDAAGNASEASYTVEPDTGVEPAPGEPTPEPPLTQAPTLAPPLFTPNDDGQNDVWQISLPQGHQLSSLKVYNQRGQVVFSTAQDNQPWDGTFRGKLLPKGAYYYSLTTINVNNPAESLTTTGSVTLIR